MTEWISFARVNAAIENLQLWSRKNIMIVFICGALFKAPTCWVLDRTWTLKYGTVAVDDGHINTLVANTTLLSLSELIKKPDGDLTWTWRTGRKPRRHLKRQKKNIFDGKFGNLQLCLFYMRPSDNFQQRLRSFSYRVVYISVSGVFIFSGNFFFERATDFIQMTFTYSQKWLNRFCMLVLTLWKKIFNFGSVRI